MGKEIERKYLLKNDSWKGVTGTHYCQGYLNSIKERTVRVRTIDEKGFLTVKGISVGATRLEYEYEIPVKDARELLSELCEKPLIEKSRFKVESNGLIWEIDEFYGENEGLVFCEVELSFEDQVIELPEWVGEEVTSDPRYFNSNLIKHPYKNW
jgi:CYTH domain-containing protein